MSWTRSCSPTSWNIFAISADYIGAPWPYYQRRNFTDAKNVRVGNSGFCLRNVKAHYNLLTEHADLTRRMMGTPNDDFYAYCGARKDINFSVPPVDIAASFSVEYLLPRSLKSIGNKLPFGVHGWTKMSADFYVKTLVQFGYDLQPFKSQMNNSDHELLRVSLNFWAMNRLVRRVQRGKPIARYLPVKHFASVRVIRDPFAMMILSRLLLENNSLAEKIFIYAPDEQDILLHELTPQKQPHLLITSGGAIDETLTAAIEKNGLIYGKRVVSFQREYLNRCEELFHNLGK